MELTKPGWRITRKWLTRTVSFASLQRYIRAKELSGCGLILRERLEMQRFWPDFAGQPRNGDNLIMHENPYHM